MSGCTRNSDAAACKLDHGICRRVLGNLITVADGRMAGALA
jgi:hypothetical protein